MSDTPQGISWGRVAGWAVAGFALEWLVIFLYVLGSLSSGDDGEPAGSVIAFLALPALFAVLLFFQRTRLAGASVLVGFLVGSVAGAGVCAGWIAAAA